MEKGTCAECGKKTEFGEDGVCKCGKELCFKCYEQNGHREHMIPDPTEVG